MKIKTSEFLVKSHSSRKLDSYPTKCKNYHDFEDSYVSVFERQHTLSELQNKLFAGAKQSVLIIVQGMDASGKDSLISGLAGTLHPQGCQTFSFKVPTGKELQHDFLWRSNFNLPEKGHMAFFNRSYYEELLVPRVHPQALQMENLPSGAVDGKNFWKNRLKDIVHYEDYLHHQGISIVKLFLHISKEEQKKRLLSRIERPEKNWKFDPHDMVERQNWNKYQNLYEWFIHQTSTDSAPWYIIPADNKPIARLIASEILIKTLKKLNLSYPALTPSKKRELKKIARQLEQE